MRAGVWLSVLLFLMSLAALPAAAESRFALVIANSKYESAPLSNPNVDAGLVSKSLRDVGFDVTVVEDASLERFDEVLAEFTDKVRGADLALFYYAGHGFAVTDRGTPRNYLMSTDADVTSRSERVLRAGGIPLDDIISAVSEQAKATLVFIDACRNDPRVNRAVGGRGRGAVAIDNNIGESIFVGMSTRAGDVATDGSPGQGSPFARAFAEKIGQPGARVDDTFTQIRIAVEAETKRAQRPDVGRYDLLTPVVLKPVEAPPAVAEAPASAPPTAPVSGDEAPSKPAEVATLMPESPRALISPPALSDPRAECERLAGSPDPNGAEVPFDNVDATKAVPACQAALNASPDDARLLYLLGKSHDKAGQYEAALLSYQRSSELGNRGATNNLGTLYRDGSGLARDYVKARELFEVAASQGNSVAMRNLGALYEEGLGVERDYVKARENYERAAERNNSYAINGLGVFYELGQGVERDYAKAREYYQRAGDLGNDVALNNLGVLYENGTGMTPDFAKARDLYEKASKLGNVLAENNLGALYHNGKGVAKDYAKAREHYEKAAAQNNGLALSNLGILYEYGFGVAKDFTKAREYYEKAAEQNNSVAIKNLGGLYENGSGVTKDLVRARQYYERAADLGNPAAFHSLGYFYEDGLSVTADRQTAARYIEQALRKGNEFSARQMKTNAPAWSVDFRKALQTRLKDAGVYSGPVDGQFGPATFQAVDAIFGTES